MLRRGENVFVPEGQHDGSQARSAWSHEENSLVPAGRLNGSRLRLDANIPFNRNTWVFLKRHELGSTTNISETDKGTDNDFDPSTVPPGTGALCVATQALRAWLLSASPSGTKAIRPSKGLALS
jgi:hypothetical protein